MSSQTDALRCVNLVAKPRKSGSYNIDQSHAVHARTKPAGSKDQRRRWGADGPRRKAAGGSVA